MSCIASISVDYLYYSEYPIRSSVLVDFPEGAISWAIFEGQEQVVLCGR